MKNHRRNFTIPGIVIGIILIGLGNASSVFAAYHVQTDKMYFYLFNVIGIVLVCAGITPLAMIYESRKHDDHRHVGTRRSRREKEFIGGTGRKKGERIRAEILGVSRSLRSGEDEKEKFYIVCRGKDAKQDTYTSRALPEYPGKEVIGKEVTVEFHSGEPGDYTVLIDEVLKK